MARAEGDIVITVGADTSGVAKGAAEAERHLGRLNKATKEADAGFKAMAKGAGYAEGQLLRLLGVNDKFVKSASNSASVFEADFKRMEGAVDRLRASYDPIFAASKRYEAAVEQLDEALKRGAITQQQYATMTQKLASSMLTMDGQQRSVTGGMGSLTSQVQNASYQVGDFFVQIASGTDATRALAQQMPQLLGGFGMWGALAGAAVAIGGALVPMLFDTADAAEAGETAFNNLTSAISAAKSAQETANLTIGEARLQYGALAEEAVRAAQAIYGVEVANAQTGLTMLLTENGNALAVIREHINAINATTLWPEQWGDDRARALKTLMEGLHEEFKITTVEASRLVAAVDDLQRAKGIDEQVKAAQQLEVLLVEIYGSLEDMPPEVRKIYDGLAKAVQAAVSLAGVDMASPIDAAATAADRLKRNLAAAVGVAGQLAILQQNGMGFAPEYNRFGNAASGEAMVSSPRPRPAPLDPDFDLPDSDKGSGGGGKKGKDAARDLEKLQQDFMTEQELLQVQYDERLVALQEARNNELLTEQQYQDMKLQSQKDFNDKSRALDRSALQEKLAAWSGAFGDLSSLMNTGNKKLFKIGKAAAIAQAVVDGWSAATTAWEKGMKVGGPPVAAAFTAMSLLRTGAMIASIKSTQFEGGGGGGAGGGGSAAAAAPAQSQAKVANYQISGDVLGKQSTAQLFKDINQGIKDGYTIHNAEWVTA